MTKFNPLSHIMRSAHWASHCKRVSGDGRRYAEIFREQLRLSWQRWNTQQEAKRNWQVRQQLRDEQNAGLPLASCAYDLAAKRRSVMLGRRDLVSVGA